jgi:hypothetical protein
MIDTGVGREAGKKRKKEKKKVRNQKKNQWLDKVALYTPYHVDPSYPKRLFRTKTGGQKNISNLTRFSCPRKQIRP